MSVGLLPIAWDALVADPALFSRLPASDQDAIYTQVAVLEAACRALVLARVSGQQAGSPRLSAAEPERALRIAEAAARLGMSKDYLYRHWRKLGGYKDDDGHVKFALSVIDRHVNARRPA